MNQQPPTSFSLTIADGAALSAAFCMDAFILGSVEIPTSWTDANMGFYKCSTESGTFVIARDDTGVPIQISGIITNAGGDYALPTKLAGARWVKLWSKSTTAATVTDTNQSGAITVTVNLK